VNEIVPGIYHWSAMHPSIGARVSSYYVEPAGIVIDPLEPEDGWDFFDALDTPPQQVVMTIDLHWRHCDRFRDRYGATIRGHSAGLHRFEGTDRRIEPFDSGEEIAHGVTAREFGAIAPDDTVLHITHGDGALAFADGLTAPDGILGFVPDFLMDDPPATKRKAHDKLRGLLEATEFDALLFAHGTPRASGGRRALSDFVKSHTA
jgi:hypothetical protein